MGSSKEDSLPKIVQDVQREVTLNFAFGSHFVLNMSCFFIFCTYFQYFLVWFIVLYFDLCPVIVF